MMPIGAERNARDNAKSSVTSPRFGAHMSVAGGLHRAFEAGVAVGCECLQIFVKNQRQWEAKSLTEDQARLFREAQAASGLAPVVAHASYLLNLASPDRRVRTRSIAAMRDELERCEALEVASLIVHPGARMDGSLEAGIGRIAASLNMVHRSCAGFRTRILLETTAGQGSTIGWRFEHLTAILDRVAEAERLGVCLDTCHLFAAGYDFRRAEGYAAMMDELDRAVGAARIGCIHTNDSKRPLGSRVDRHEHIGKGRIGKRAFTHFIHDPRLRNAPFILETPKGRDGRGTDLDKVNLKRLRGLVASDGGRRA